MFQGIRVADFTQVIAGPYATMQLALLGADVIKIEHPQLGDQARQIFPIEESDGAERRISAIYLSVNAGKRSMTLDLKHPDAREVVSRLIREVDVVVENFKAGTMARMGFGYEDLAAINPRLVYCSISGYGQDGPMAGVGAYDPAIQAMSGMMAVNGTPESGPIRTGFYACDMATGMSAAFAIAGALYRRAATGQGANLDVSMLEVATSFMAPVISQYTEGGRMPRLLGSRSQSGNPLADSFRTADGILMIMPTTEAHCAKLWRAVGRAELAEDPRFATMAARIANEEACVAEMEKALAEADALAWERRISDAGVPAAAVATIPQVLENPQLAHRGMFCQVPATEKPDHKVTCTTVPFRIADEPPASFGPPPPMGAQTEEILSALGFEGERIRALRRTGAI